MHQNVYLMKLNDDWKYSKNDKIFLEEKIKDLQRQKLKEWLVDRIKNNKLLNFCNDKKNMNRNVDRS